MFYLFFQLGNRKAYEAFQEGGEDGLKEYIYSKMWNPEYRYFPTNAISTKMWFQLILFFFLFPDHWCTCLPAKENNYLII